jgi:hypothetical protein
MKNTRKKYFKIVIYLIVRGPIQTHKIVTGIE